MSRKKYIVNLSEEERTELEEFVSKGTHQAEGSMTSTTVCGRVVAGSVIR